MNFTIILLVSFLTSSALAGQRLEIVKLGHPALRAKASTVDDSAFSDPKFQKLIDDMVTTMESAGGVGLAAPQINQSIRLFVMKSWPNVPLTVVVNPVIEYLEDGGKKDSLEGCLSIPGKSLKVKRYKKIHLSYFDRQGRFISHELNGFEAIIAQHEYDHLNGILIIDLIDQLFETISYSGFVDAPLM
jgi:peptide deformylase